ncbi:hypothetical protein KQX54_020942 [Cotesia glomerata]|uniref:Uncharacterized protein n=1 Tax=Cotesia glomerata TaxID=32391 RepID=A0AAV7HMG2_COTGL|nr:hypothetical protein KQX54_020942 [Cotesia glomerata]
MSANNHVDEYVLANARESQPRRIKEEGRRRIKLGFRRLTRGSEDSSSRELVSCTIIREMLSALEVTPSPAQSFARLPGKSIARLSDKLEVHHASLRFDKPVITRAGYVIWTCFCLIERSEVDNINGIVGRKERTIWRHDNFRYLVVNSAPRALGRYKRVFGFPSLLTPKVTPSSMLPLQIVESDKPSPFPIDKWTSPEKFLEYFPTKLYPC